MTTGHPTMNRRFVEVAPPGDDSEAGHARPAPTSQGPEFVVLDIGGEIGAFLLYTDEEYVGAEIDLTPAGTPRSHDIHTTIRRRCSPEGELIVGVYPQLLAGDYTVWGLGDLPTARIAVTGGQVSELRL